MVILFSIAACLLGQVQPGSEVLDFPDLKCGAYCTYVALKGLELPVGDYESFERRLGSPEREGYSLLQLSRIAEQYGARAVSAHTTVRRLQRLRERFTCIALLKTGHFVLVQDIDENGVRVIDPPHTAEFRRDLFEEVWSGDALLLSHEELAGLQEGLAWEWIVLGVLAAVTVAVGALWLATRLRAPWRPAGR